MDLDFGPSRTEKKSHELESDVSAKGHTESGIFCNKINCEYSFVEMFVFMINKNICNLGNKEKVRCNSGNETYRACEKVEAIGQINTVFRIRVPLSGSGFCFFFLCPNPEKHTKFLILDQCGGVGSVPDLDPCCKRGL